MVACGQPYVILLLSFFVLRSRAPSRVPLEVEMRFESITAVVPRNLVNAMVREITVASSFVAATILHRWLHRMPIGAMPAGFASYLVGSLTPGDFVALVQLHGDQSESLVALLETKRGVGYQPGLVLRAVRPDRREANALNARLRLEPRS